LLEVFTIQRFFYAGFFILPDVMHLVHTVTRFTPPPGWTARTFFRFGFHLRLVTLWAWLILLPNIGFLPHISQTLAMVLPVK